MEADFNRLIDELVQKRVQLALNPLFERLSFVLAIPLPTIIYTTFLWLKDEDQLERLYGILVTLKCIDCEFKEFRLHFINPKQELVLSIKWLKETVNLVSLFEALAAEKYLLKKRGHHKLLSEHFKDKENKTISPHVLSQSLGQRTVSTNEFVEHVIRQLSRSAY